MHLLEAGLEVIVIGKPDLYKSGSFKLKIEEIKPSGEGAWKKEFEELKKRLGEKGYFDESRKRPIPALIERIGLITSERGEAIFDFRNNIGNYGFKIFLYDVWVEGERAEHSITSALHYFNKNRPDMDVLVLIQGGGGFENLKVFNSEKIADAIVSSRIPVITGIGHEKDESIADYVADKRLSTPTAVAVFLKTQREDLMREVDILYENLEERMQYIWEEQKLAINTQVRELELSITHVLKKYRFSVTQQTERLHRGFGKVFEGFANLKQRLVRARYAYEKQIYVYLASVERAQSMLASLNPENVLQRGYSITLNSKGEVVKSYKQVLIGEETLIRLSEGGFSSRVERKFKNQKTNDQTKSTRSS